MGEVKRYKVLRGDYMSPTAPNDENNYGENRVDIEVVLASDYALLEQQVEQLNKAVETHKNFWRECQEDAKREKHRTEQAVALVAQLTGDVGAKEWALANAEARVKELEQVPAKYDCSITYRQHEKKWIVRYISWGQDQKMFTGEAENLMEAVSDARKQMAG